MNSENIKEHVKATYTKVAYQTKQQNQSSCCGSGSSCCGSDEDELNFSEDYSNETGYFAGADMGVGCGMPVKFSGIKDGDTVVDLGSGAGNDVFVARSQCGESGRVIGVDMTPAMIERAVANNEKLGYSNVEFKLGDIEKIPAGDNTADVVISNCVLNLVPDKEKAFSEIYRILKPGGHFCISDIVTEGRLPQSAIEAYDLYSGCISGAIEKKEYLSAIENAQFNKIEILSSKIINVPDSILREYLKEDELTELKESGTQILSLTITGKK